MARINFKEPARGPNDCPLQHTYNDRLGTNIHKEDGHLFAAVCFCPASRPQSIELSNEENYLKRWIIVIIGRKIRETCRKLIKDGHRLEIQTAARVTGGKEDQWKKQEVASKGDGQMH